MALEDPASLQDDAAHLAFCHRSTTDNTDDKRAAMPSVSFVRASLLLAVAMLLAGAGLQSTLLSIRAGIEDFPIVVTGLVMSAYYAGYIVGDRKSVVWGKSVSERVDLGVRRIIK